MLLSEMTSGKVVRRFFLYVGIAAAVLVVFAAATPQLVLVRYFPYHNVNFEWVYNHAHIMHSNVIWARDLGAEHNRLLLQLLPDRTVWLVEGDRRDPHLIPYSESIQSAPMPRESRSPAPDQD